MNETFMDRLITEKTELDEKISKLNTFLESDVFKGIEPVQMSLLNIQAQAMASYSQCLLERIAWLNGGVRPGHPH